MMINRINPAKRRISEPVRDRMTNSVPIPRKFDRAEYIADATVHMIGVTAALLAVPVLIALATVWQSDAAMIVAVSVYGASLLAMLSFSAGYNVLSVRLANGRAIEVLRRLDHAAIYVKIAGTYTPYAVLAGGPVGRWLLIGVWTTAAVGTLGKLIAPNRWQKLSIVLYLGLGWCFVMVSDEITAVITNATLILIAVGGVLYTVGVIFHLWQSLPFQNAIWHGFVLIATFVFYAALLVEISGHGWAGPGKI